MVGLHVTINATDLPTGEEIYHKADNYMFIGSYTSCKFFMHLYSHSLLMIYTYVSWIHTIILCCMYVLQVLAVVAVRVYSLCI